MRLFFPPLYNIMAAAAVLFHPTEVKSRLGPFIQSMPTSAFLSPERRGRNKTEPADGCAGGDDGVASIHSFLFFLEIHLSLSLYPSLLSFGGSFHPGRLGDWKR